MTRVYPDISGNIKHHWIRSEKIHHLAQPVSPSAQAKKSKSGTAQIKANRTQQSDLMDHPVLLLRWVEYGRGLK